MQMKINHDISLHESRRFLDPLSQPANATTRPFPHLLPLAWVALPLAVPPLSLDRFSLSLIVTHPTTRSHLLSFIT
jgi:hypothetical protein